MSEKSFDRIRQKFISYAAKDRLCGFSASVLLDGKSEFVCSGTLSLNSNKVVDENTLFEIGSVSKPVTAAIIINLYQKGFLDINESIAPYLDNAYDVHPIFNHIKITDLLVHRAGIPRLTKRILSKMKGHDPYGSIGTDDLANFLASPEELRQPGNFRYSNLGYSLLGEIIKQVTVKNFDGACDEHLFNRLGMKRSGTLQKFKDDANKASGHHLSGKPAPYWTGITLDGPGSILSTASDMLHFLKYSMQLEEPGKFAWQLKSGWLSALLGFKGFYWHNGMTGGFGSYIAFDRKRNAGLFVVTNKPVLLNHYFYYFSSYAKEIN